jgi:hypothetical protein
MLTPEPRRKDIMPDTAYLTIGTYDTPAERLRAVADLIEAHPEAVDMAYFVDADAFGAPSDVNVDPIEAAQAHTCGTAGCLAGWAVASAPAHVLPHPPAGWAGAGAVAFGLSLDRYSPYSAGHALFMGKFIDLQSGEFYGDLPSGTFTRRASACLRWLADLSDADRLAVTSDQILAFAEGEHDA